MRGIFPFLSGSGGVCETPLMSQKLCALGSLWVVFSDSSMFSKLYQSWQQFLIRVDEDCRSKMKR